MMKPEISYAKVQARYGGKFIAHFKDRVLVSDRTYPGLIRKIAQKGLDRKKLTIGLVPPKDIPCIYAC